MVAQEEIKRGRIYRYVSSIPEQCKGHLYRVLRTKVFSVPDYTYKIIVEALSGPDKGQWFICSPANFSIRYDSVEEEEGEVSKHDQ